MSASRAAFYVAATLMMVAAATAVLMIVTPVAHARWRPEYANSPPVVQNFFEGAKTCVGGSCCGMGDGHRFLGTYELTPDGGAVVHIDNATYVVKPCSVIKSPNPTGSAVIWYSVRRDVDMSEHVGSVYCFAPGALT